MKVRPLDFVDADKVIAVIENSIESAIDWQYMTDDRLGDTEERISQLQELMDIVCLLKWRYGHDRVVFKFTMKKMIPDVVPAPVESPNWANRIWVNESEELSKVYINF